MFCGICMLRISYQIFSQHVLTLNPYPRAFQWRSSSEGNFIIFPRIFMQNEKWRAKKGPQFSNQIPKKILIFTHHTYTYFIGSFNSCKISFIMAKYKRSRFDNYQIYLDNLTEVKCTRKPNVKFLILSWMVFW